MFWKSSRQTGWRLLKKNVCRPWQPWQILRPSPWHLFKIIEKLYHFQGSIFGNQGNNKKLSLFHSFQFRQISLGETGFCLYFEDSSRRASLSAELFRSAALALSSANEDLYRKMDWISMSVLVAVFKDGLFIVGKDTCNWCGIFLMLPKFFPDFLLK